jgi:glycosyltransferase involved in cell wall biosynthesis
MVLNEADIIGETLDNLIEQGVDHLLVADNGSTDGTLDILKSRGVHLVHDPSVSYWQGKKISHLARAAVRNGASWIIPFDADELWKGHEGRTLRETLHSCDSDLVAAEWFDYVPLAAKTSGGFAERFPWREPEPAANGKVALRANWLARVTIGNHDASVPGNRRAVLLRIAHYRYRSIEQAMRKAREGALASSLGGAKVHYWSTLATGTASDAAEVLRALTARTDLVYDPASEW